MKAIDMQVNVFSKERGGMFRDPVIEADLMKYFKSGDQLYTTDEEMINELKAAGVKAVIFSATWKALGWKDFDEVKKRHDHIGELIAKYPDTVIGAWVALDPNTGYKGLKELERCIVDLKMFGVAACGALTGVPVNDRMWYIFYDLCRELKVPVKLWVGHLAMGGSGVRIYPENPIPHVDDVAAEFPDLTIICAHSPWPFHNEMTSVLINKPNVYNEVHGTSPKYIPAEYKREMNSRIQDKVMFGSDYPLLNLERLFKDWDSENFKPAVLEKIYYGNAERVLGLK
ncbi:MAG: amidohydrolase family protein [Syntrophales bacterium]